jgi:hypothetical protein
MKLPLFFKPILWSFDFSRLSLIKDKHLIILNTINYGDFKHWKWIAEFYGKEEISRIIFEAPVGRIRKRAKILAAIIFKINIIGNEKRSINAKR